MKEKDILKKEFIRNQKKINNKKTSKEERQALIKKNQDILFKYTAVSVAGSFGANQVKVNDETINL